jgi:rubrerythrin
MIAFNADEIFEMAEQIERNGAAFYRKAASGSKMDNAELLLRLAAMEDDHERTFHEMRQGLGTGSQATTTFDPDDEGAQYLRAMADSKVFDVSVDPSEALTGDESVEEVLNMAIGLEKDSIVFYVGMKDMVSAVHGKEKLDAIIRQEMGHIKTLSEELAARS